MLMNYSSGSYVDANLIGHKNIYSMNNNSDSSVLDNGEELEMCRLTTKYNKLQNKIGL